MGKQQEYDGVKYLTFINLNGYRKINGKISGRQVITVDLVKGAVFQTFFDEENLSEPAGHGAFRISAELQLFLTDFGNQMAEYQLTDEELADLAEADEEYISQMYVSDDPDKLHQVDAEKLPDEMLSEIERRLNDELLPITGFEILPRRETASSLTQFGTISILFTKEAEGRWRKLVDRKQTVGETWWGFYEDVWRELYRKEADYSRWLMDDLIALADQKLPELMHKHHVGFKETGIILEPLVTMMVAFQLRAKNQLLGASDEVSIAELKASLQLLMEHLLDGYILAYGRKPSFSTKQTQLTLKEKYFKKRHKHGK